MQTPKPDFHGKRLTRALAVFLCVVLAASFALAQSKLTSPVEPLPQDTGTAGLKQMLLRLHTTARMMQTTAHPDDEDGGLLTLESRGEGVTVTLMTLNRGEGGQNKIGSNLFDVLGVLRALELTASDQHYGVEQRFSRVADFGYSKNPEETFQKWQGHDIPLGDMVRVIRSFRPDVLIARFSGTPRDGHGHHEASGLLTMEAFHAAGDSNRFPEQIKEGLLPWQPKKLYIGNVCGFMASSCAEENYTLKLNTGEVNPALGMSYIQFAVEGLRHQLSQGAGGWSVDTGPHYAYYKLTDTAAGKPDWKIHEKDFFDGIDTSLPGLAARLGEEENKLPFLRIGLTEVAKQIEEATAKSEKDPAGAVPPLSSAAEKLGSVIHYVETSALSAQAKLELLQRLREKYQQAEKALNLAAAMSLEATAIIPNDGSAAVSPGQKLEIKISLHNGARYPITVNEVTLEGFENWAQELSNKKDRRIEPGKDFFSSFAVQAPWTAAYTRPYWHRNSPEEDAINTIDDAKYVTLPFPPSPYHVRVNYSSKEHVLGQISAPVMVSIADKEFKSKRALAVAPIFSVMLDPGEQVIPTDTTSVRTVRVELSSNLDGAPKGTLHLEAPAGWRVDPATIPVNLTRRGEKQEFEFKVVPSTLQEGKRQIRAVMNAGGKSYSEGYNTVSREDLDTFYYYQPATQRVSMVSVKAPEDLKVGYVMGAGDEIPTVLKQVGIDVTQISADKLASEDLSRYGTVVLGIRAYDTQKEVAANNKKLLDFVSGGGTLVVQYNAGVGDFNSGHFTPFPAQMSRSRVSVEEAPVEILAADDSVFRFPNQITQADFNGWVQERGLYFMDSWDDHFKPLLSSHDPGEPPQKGGLIRAQYGKGTYIYAGYAFFRQLPAGVPGAIRLYVNLLSAGHEK
jgi:LmbE family N-acetylglucosaminyl deacetylase